MKKGKKPLSEPKKAFCEAYIGSLNGKQAAIECGYAEKNAATTAHKIMKEPEVQEYVQELMDQRVDRTNITADYVLAEIVECMGVAKRCVDLRAWLKAAELLGKHLKLFTDVQEHQFNLTKMGRVEIGSGDQMVAIEFNVGDEPNKLEDQRS